MNLKKSQGQEGWEVGSRRVAEEGARREEAPKYRAIFSLFFSEFRFVLLSLGSFHAGPKAWVSHNAPENPQPRTLGGPQP